MLSADAPTGSPPAPEEKVDLERSSLILRRSFIRALIQDFGPLWFTWCMNSGVIAILLHELPYQFHGLHVISTIFFVVDLVLFILFSLIFLARFIVFRVEAYHEIVNDFASVTLLACWPIGFLTLPALIALIVSNASWAGHGWTVFAYVLWWIGAAWILQTLFFAFITLIRRHGTPDKRLPTTIILPAVGVATLAVTGGLITINADHISPRLAVPVIVFSFLCVGIGFMMGVFLSTYLFHHLLSQSWPHPAQTASLFIFVGPMGQCAAALQILGAAARTYQNFGAYNKGSFLTAEAAAPLEAACVLLALLLTGMGFVWFVISLCAMFEFAWLGKLQWSPGWNAIIFPTGTLATSTLQLGIVMDSPAWRVITTILVVFMVVVYLGNLVGTVWKVSRGELLVVRTDPRVKAILDERERTK